MSKKQSQSILDFLNFMPLQSIMVGRSPINNKEATVLFNIWKESKRDHYGNIVLSKDADPTSIASLTSKGIVKNKSGHSFGDRVIEITSKGKNIIKNIVLHSEKSAFEKSADTIDYESIYRLTNKPILEKSASRIEREPKSWFQKALWR